jgi:hypothetical protein
MNSIAKTGNDRTCPDGLRNRFFQRKRMLAEDFKIEQDYMISRRRLLSRSVLGWGVVYGFAIEGGSSGAASCKSGEFADPQGAAQGVRIETVGADGATTSDATPTATAEAAEKPRQPHVLNIGAGFGLDACGREAVLAAPVALTAENTFLLVNVDNLWCPRRIDAELNPGRYMLSVHYAERTAGATVPSSFCCCGDEEWTHLCETVLFSLRWMGEQGCICAEPDCAGGSACRCDTCGGHSRSHARLVEWATDRDFSQTSELRPWSPFKVALDAPIDLACVELVGAPDKCKPLQFTEIDASSPRRIVKTNDSLYDLIRGCDLTRIEKVSWQGWHRNRKALEWDEFASFFTTQEYAPDSLLTKFTVRFSGPVLVETVRRDAVAITVQMVDGGTGWIRSRRIPISGLDTTPSVQSLPAGTTDQFTVAVAKRWMRDEIDQGGESYLSERDFVVEIEIRGDLIEDCSGQTVDANTVGLVGSPTGNGAPGGTYFSSFKVKRSVRSQAEDNERTAS